MKIKWPKHLQNNKTIGLSNGYWLCTCHIKACTLFYWEVAITFTTVLWKICGQILLGIYKIGSFMWEKFTDFAYITVGRMNSTESCLVRKWLLCKFIHHYTIIDNSFVSKHKIGQHYNKWSVSAVPMTVTHSPHDEPTFAIFLLNKQQY